MFSWRYFTHCLSIDWILIATVDSAMASEFQNLTLLLEAIQLTQDAHEKLKTAQETLDNPETEDKENATAEFDRCLQEVTRSKEIEKNYRKVARSHLVGNTESESNKEEETVTENNKEKTKSTSKSSMSFKLPQLDKFKRGENFSKFCDKFLEYVTLGSVQGDNLPLIFLQMVDDFTREKLKKISLTPGQSRDAKEFMNEYMKKMCPPHEGSTFRALLADIKQKSSGESVEDFAFRISETASRAFSDSQDLLREDACFSSFRKGLKDPSLKMKLHEDVTITTFEKAVEEASRLEGIRTSLGVTSQVESTEDDHEVLALDTSDKDGEHNDASENNDRQNSYRNRNQPDYTRSQQYQPRAGRQNGYQQRFSHQGRGSSRFSEQNARNSNDSSRSQPWMANQPQQKGDKNRNTIRCYKCNELNHIARHCTAPLNM